MAVTSNFYREKFYKYKEEERMRLHSPEELAVLEEWTVQFRLSFQQIKVLSETWIDLKNWKEASLEAWYEEYRPFANKNQFWKAFQEYRYQVQSKAPQYPETQKKALQAHSFEVTYEELNSPVFKACPTTSPDWICCGLKVIDIVENCNLGCSYCILQDFYQDQKIRIAKNPKERLAKIQLEPGKRYRITTGEYSDSLMWGNSGNILEELCLFAQEHPQVLLELKTKSVNVNWLLQNREKVPQNLMVSWSLNPPKVIANEEAATPRLEARLKAARALANAQIKIGWHIHPILHFEGFEKDYFDLGTRLRAEFNPEEIVAFSLGTLNFIKSHLQKVRKNIENSQILRTLLKHNGDNKWTYSDEIRIQMYRCVLDGMGEWAKDIPCYLCMEPLSIWQAIFPQFPHRTTESFIEAFTQQCFERLLLQPPSCSAL
jgi:spore photoproduct lyase